MKKQLFFGILALSLGMSMTSCDKDGKEEMTTQISVTAYNLFSPLSGTGTVSTAYTNYSLSLKYPDNTMTLWVDNMSLPDGGTGSFTLNPIEFTNESNNAGQAYSIKNPAPTGTGATVTNLSATVTNKFNVPPTIENLNYPYIVPSSVSYPPYFMVADYTLNNSTRVRTFWPDVDFKGKTTIVTQGLSTNYENEDMSYRVVMGRDEQTNALGNTATLLIYDAKFAEAMPSQTVIVLEGLTLTFNATGWRISGQNIVPKMYSDGNLVDFPAFPFNSIDMSSTGNMTSVSCIYTVRGTYYGTFTGSCIATAE